jgi:hypothetical protein
MHPAFRRASRDCVAAAALKRGAATCRAKKSFKGKGLALALHLKSNCLINYEHRQTIGADGDWTEARAQVKTTAPSSVQDA